MSAPSDYTLPMPFVESNGAKIHYALAGPAGRPVLVLSNSLGTDFSMWDPQISEFTKSFRVLRYDTRGHGKSSVTAGPYSAEQLANDVFALADALKLDRFHFCGLSMGGDRKSTRLNSSHVAISYAVFCLKKKT